MSGNLRRLAVEAPAPEPPPSAADERCEFCAADIGERHGHVADLAEHRLLCVCRPCYLLFAPEGAGGGRYRGVGEEVRRVADLRITPAHWDALRVPVDLVFFFRQTGVDHLLAFYPGPGGATESELDLTAWDGIVSDNPVVDAVAADVEAVLLRRHEGGDFSCHLVPVDLCYELVGIVRSSWRGLGGGVEVWQEIDAFFAALDERSTSVDRGAA